MDDKSSINIESSTGDSAKLGVILPIPIPSVIEDPSEFNSPF